jgi:hypothetical protein
MTLQLLDELMRYAEENETSSTCLVQLCDDVFGIAILPFPKKDATFSEVSNWRLKKLDGVIPLNQGYGLQLTSMYSIERFSILIERAKRVAKELELTDEDVIMPFFGGIIGYDFREFLKRAFDLNGKSFWDYESLYDDYLKETMLKIKEKKTKPSV